MSQIKLKTGPIARLNLRYSTPSGRRINRVKTFCLTIVYILVTMGCSVRAAEDADALAKALETLKVIDPKYTSLDSMPRSPHKQDIVMALYAVSENATLETLPVIRRILTNARAHYISIGFQGDKPTILDGYKGLDFLGRAIEKVILDNYPVDEERFRYLCRRWVSFQCTDVRKNLDFVEMGVVCNSLASCSGRRGPVIVMEDLSKMVLLRDWALYDDNMRPEFEGHRRDFWEAIIWSFQANIPWVVAEKYTKLDDPVLDRLWHDLFYYGCTWGAFGVNELKALLERKGLARLSKIVLESLHKGMGRVLEEQEAQLKKDGCTIEDKTHSGAQRYRKLSETRAWVEATIENMSQDVGVQRTSEEEKPEVKDGKPEDQQ